MFISRLQKRMMKVRRMLRDLIWAEERMPEEKPRIVRKIIQAESVFKKLAGGQFRTLPR